MRSIVSTLAGAALLSWAPFAAAQTVLDPNQIHGNVRFTNTDPAVLSIINLFGNPTVTAYANSTSPAGYAAGVQIPGVSPTQTPYLLSAESGAAGPGGILYTVGAWNNYNNAAHPGSIRYYFQSVPGILLQPPANQPGGAAVDIEECIGIIRIQWGLDPTCQTPFTITSGDLTTVDAQNIFGSHSTHYAFIPGGQNVTRTLSYSVGNDPTSNQLTWTRQVLLNPACDQIQDICIDVSPDQANLGALVGPFDILGETELGNTYIRAHDGPDGNQRYRNFTPPEMPISPATGWWRLPNMMAGDYSLYAEALVRTGRYANQITIPRLDPTHPQGMVTVVPGVDSDLQRTINGQSRYPYVMTPAAIKGKIHLYDPYVPQNLPGAYSSLSALWFATDHGSARPGGTLVQSKVKGNVYGASETGFPGAFDPATGELSSTYALVVANPYDIPLDWVYPTLDLRFDDPSTNRKGDLDITLVTSPGADSFLLGPNDLANYDFDLCFGEVTLNLSTTTGQILDPQTDIYSLNPAVFNVRGTMYGTPATPDAPQSAGQIHMALPVGNYILHPAAVVMAGGSSNGASFPTVELSVGCGQQITAENGLAVTLDPLPPCADPSGSVTLSGLVTSSSGPVDHIWYTVNGGAPIDICTSGCGANPTFSVPAQLAACNNTIQVFASSTAANATASSTAQTVWEDPSDGVDCGVAACTPPAPTCMEIDDKAIQCDANDQGATGTYSYTFVVHNTSNVPVSHLLLPGSHVAPNTVTLSPSLAPGDSRSVTVTLSGVNPGASQCLTIGMLDESMQECCSQEHCVTPPTCCFTTSAETTSCVAGAPPGTFTHSFDLTNLSSEVIEHVFLFPPAGVTVNPTYIDIPSTLPGGTVSVGPVTWSGAVEGKDLCFTVGIHDEALNECCSSELCVTAPLCSAEPDKQNSLLGDKEAAASCAVNGAKSGDRGAAALLLGVAVAAAARRRRRGARA